MMLVRLKIYGAMLAAFVGTILAAYFSGRRAKAAGIIKQELKAHGRINEAEIGIGASDADRVKRLRDIAAKWRS